MSGAPRQARPTSKEQKERPLGALFTWANRWNPETASRTPLKALEPDGVSPFMDNGCVPIAVFL
jgi:hypothetical protein